MAIPAKAARHMKSFHRLIAQNDIFNRPGQENVHNGASPSQKEGRRNGKNEETRSCLVETDFSNSLFRSQKSKILNSRSSKLSWGISSNMNLTTRN